VLKTGGAVSTVAAGQANPRGVAADDSGVYWGNTADGRVMKRWPDGLISAFVAGEPSPWGITTDATHVYWTNRTGMGTVVSAPK
jgi:hypothetical protein